MLIVLIIGSSLFLGAVIITVAVLMMKRLSAILERSSYAQVSNAELVRFNQNSSVESEDGSADDHGTKAAQKHNADVLLANGVGRLALGDVAPDVTNASKHIKENLESLVIVH